MLILLTNDDGISAPGLVALYRELTDLGEVHVVAPASVQSATSHGITLSTPLLTSRVTVPDAFTGIAVDGRPADCVKLAVAHFLPKPPDLVISGMNSGANVGINVIYSGTIAAALEAAFLGLPAIAVSLHLGKDIPTDYKRSAKLARQTIDTVLEWEFLRAGRRPSTFPPCGRKNRPWASGSYANAPAPGPTSMSAAKTRAGETISGTPASSPWTPRSLILTWPPWGAGISR